MTTPDTTRFLWISAGCDTYCMPYNNPLTQLAFACQFQKLLVIIWLLLLGMLPHELTFIDGDWKEILRISMACHCHCLLNLSFWKLGFVVLVRGTNSVPTAEAEALWRLWGEILAILPGGYCWERTVALEAETAECAMPSNCQHYWLWMNTSSVSLEKIGKIIFRMEFWVELLDFTLHVKRVLQFFP